MLLERLRNGDSTAFASLYERYRERVLHYCIRLVKDTQVAEDIVQNVFIKLHRERNTIRNGHSLKSWVFAVARNESYGEIHKKKLESIDDNVVWSGSLPDEILQEKERNEIIEYALQQLHVPYREVVLLREYEQMSYEEIAATMGTTVSSVKSRLFKARKALIEKLNPYL